MITKESISRTCLNKFPTVIISKLKRRLECIRLIQVAHKNVKIHDELKQFHRECIFWLERITEQGAIKEVDFLSDLRLTEKGDIFKGDHNGILPNGYGFWISRKNQLIQWRFNKGVIQAGYWRILYSNGEYYEGFVNHGGIRQGEGIHYYINGDIYDGEFVQNKRVGKSRLRLHDGSEFIGQFIDNEIDGHGIYTDAQGNRYMSIAVDERFKYSATEVIVDKTDKQSGYFYKLRLNGQGEIKFKNGNSYLGLFKGGKRDDKGNMSYVVPTGSDPSEIGEFSGTWKSDKRNGYGVMMYLNGWRFEGIWKDDQKHSGVFYDVEGSVYEGKFHNNKYEGKGKLTFISGLIIEGEFEKGKLK